MKNVDLTPVREGLRDVAYMTIGLGAVAVDELRARRREIAEKVSTRLATEKERQAARRAELRNTLDARFAEFDKRLDLIETRIEAAVDRVEARLPEQAGHLVGQARNIGRVARQQVRDRIRPAA